MSLCPDVLMGCVEDIVYTITIYIYIYIYDYAIQMSMVYEIVTYTTNIKLINNLCTTLIIEL